VRLLPPLKKSQRALNQLQIEPKPDERLANEIVFQFDTHDYLPANIE